MRDFKDFTNDFIAVVCKDKKDINKFLELCEKNGLKWMGDELEPTSYDVPEYVKVIFCRNGFLQHNDKYGDIRCGYEIVDATEFLENGKVIE